MRRGVGARGPQNVDGLTAWAVKLYRSSFNIPFCQEFAAASAADFMRQEHQRSPRRKNTATLSSADTETMAAAQ